MTFALNHLSYFLLTNLLLDTLMATAKAHGGARIVTVASGAHRRCRAALRRLADSRRLHRLRRLRGLQLANLLFNLELSRRLAGSGVTANAVHPGLVSTGFGGNNRSGSGAGLCRHHRVGRTPEHGADSLIYLAAAPEVARVNGSYFFERQAIATSPAAGDELAARRLWDISEQLTGRRSR